ncbi:phosphatase PAP2 family protein [Streptomyces gamaensis]|uniref:Phosphatase PAP2 family protein n=1 Tax=Streptomyces gamaensis TaxID=1763542 RepID=A0ABW0YXN7_9ACTN
MTAATSLALDGPSVDGPWYTQVTDTARHAPAWLNSVAGTWTVYGVLLFGALLAAAWWSARRTGGRAMAAVLCAPFTVGAALALNAVVKNLVAEQRPCRALPGSFTVEPCPALNDYSFPSNHAAMAGAIAAAVWIVNRRLGVIASVAALLMAASRVWTGVHYPHDVLAGLAVGVTVVLLAHALLHRTAARLLPALTRTPLRPLLTATAADGHER